MRTPERLRRVVPTVVALLAAGVASCVVPAGASRGSGEQESPPLPPTIRWARIYGAGDENSAPVLRLNTAGSRAPGVGSTGITLSFDVLTEGYPNLELRLVHCDRNWRPTQNTFVQDYMRLHSTDFDIRPATAGARGYSYSVSITFPRQDAMLRIEHSGNYLARVVDLFDADRVYLERRFFVVEGRSDVDVTTYGDFYESPLTDVVQHGIRAVVEARPDVDLFAQQINAIALIRWGDWDHPLVASNSSISDEYATGAPRMRWGSFLGGKGIAEFYNIPAGNENRILDLTDIGLYPSTGAIITTPLSDLPRQGFSEFDNNGVARTAYVSAADDDYVYFEFRLDLGGRAAREDLFVVGTFNDWTPSEQWRMTFDEVSKLYRARGFIRRARQEYYYIAGNWDADKGVLRNADASLTEGNVTLSTQALLALIYYGDLSGYDRIIGSAMGWTHR